jgi:branched-chain amino acid transport system permease protein
MLLLQLLVNGLQVGAIYALTAVGFSLIFGATRIFHFAHGSTFTIAGYLFYWLFAVEQQPAAVALGAAAAAALAFGLAMDRFVYRPIQRHEGSFFTVFIGSFGVAIVVQALVGVLMGRGFVTASTPLSSGMQVLPGLYLAALTLIAIAALAVFVGGLGWLLKRTDIGVGLRALSESHALVRTYGHDPARLSRYAFALGSLLTVPAAVLTACTSGLNPAIGQHVMLISLAATIVGGVGSLKGAVYAGMLLGLTENLSSWRLPTQWSEAASFVVLFLFIIFRPTGFYGVAQGR